MATTASGQLGTDFSPRTFEGSPLSVRVDAQEEGKAALFRVYAYDENGHITRLEQGSDRMGATMIVEFKTDDAGRVTSSSANFMGNPTIRYVYTYDEKGRPTGYTIYQLRSGEESGSQAIEYDDKGNAVRQVTRVKNRPEETSTREFDDAGRVIVEEVTANDRVVRKTATTYDENGCMVKRVITLPSGREDWSLWARDENCLPQKLDHTNAMGRRWVTIYTHDAHGNVLTETRSAGAANQPGSSTTNTWSYVYPEKKTDASAAGEAASE